MDKYLFDPSMDKYLYTFPNFNGTTVEVWEGIGNFPLCLVVGILIYAVNSAVNKIDI